MGIIVHRPMERFCSGSAAERAKKLSGRPEPRKADGCRGEHAGEVAKERVSIGAPATNAGDGVIASCEVRRTKQGASKEDTF